MAAQYPQLQQPLQQQQPPVVFPNTVTNQPTQPSHSDGSFGTSFIVLAVIVVVSAIACCLGRFCNRRHNKSKPSKQHKQKNDKFRPSKEKGRDGNDIEFGFEKGLASKPMSNGEHHGGGGAGSGTGFKTFHNGRINSINSGHHGPMNGHNGPMNGHHGPMNGHNGPMNGHTGPMNGHGPVNGGHGPKNGGHGGHFKGVTIAEPVFSVG